MLQIHFRRYQLNIANSRKVCGQKFLPDVVFEIQYAWKVSFIREYFNTKKTIRGIEWKKRQAKIIRWIALYYVGTYSSVLLILFLYTDYGWAGVTVTLTRQSDRIELIQWHSGASAFILAARIHIADLLSNWLGFVLFPRRDDGPQEREFMNGWGRRQSRVDRQVERKKERKRDSEGKRRLENKWQRVPSWRYGYDQHLDSINMYAQHVCRSSQW